MLRRPLRATRTDTLFPYTTLFRSAAMRRPQPIAARRFPEAAAGSGCRSSTVLRRRPRPPWQDYRPCLSKLLFQRFVAALGMAIARTLGAALPLASPGIRSEEHTSELPSLMRISYAVFCLKKQKKK